MDRTQKAELVDFLNGVFNDTSAVIVAHYKGLSVAEITDLRQQMRESGASFKVTKNRLARRALDGTKCQPISELFTGPTAIAYGDDPVAPAKVAVEYAKKNENLVILGGMMGETELDANGVKNLASLPSLDELRSKIVGLLNAPATRVATVTQAPASKMARVFGAFAEKGDAA